MKHVLLALLLVGCAAETKKEPEYCIKAEGTIDGNPFSLAREQDGVCDDVGIYPIYDAVRIEARFDNGADYLVVDGALSSPVDLALFPQFDLSEGADHVYAFVNGVDFAAVEGVMTWLYTSDHTLTITATDLYDYDRQHTLSFTLVGKMMEDCGDLQAFCDAGVDLGGGE
jgi:hypothetical protein